MTQFSVTGMSCGHCKSSIEDAISLLDPFAEVEINLEAKTMKVTDGPADAEIVGALKEAGFEAIPDR